MKSAKIDTAVLQAFLDAFNAHDVDRVMCFFAEDCVCEMPRGPPPTPPPDRAADQASRAPPRAVRHAMADRRVFIPFGRCAGRGSRSRWAEVP